MPKSRKRKPTKKTQKTPPRRRPDAIEPEDLRQMFTTMMETALRASEVAQIRVDDIDFDNHQMRLRPEILAGEEAYEAVRRVKEEEAAAVIEARRRGHPLDLETYRAEQRQTRRIGHYVKPGVMWACDYPYHELGASAHHGRSYALMVETSPEGPTQTPTGIRVLNDAHRTTVARANSWEALEEAVKTAAADRDAWWARATGQRQAVYGHAFLARLDRVDDEEDALDYALGAADHPFLNMDYMAAWCKAAPDEVAANTVARAILGNIGWTEAQLRDILRTR